MIARVLLFVVVLLAMVALVAVCFGTVRVSARVSKGQDDSPVPVSEQCTCHVRLTSFLKEQSANHVFSGTHQFDCLVAVTDPELVETTTTSVLLDVDREDVVYKENEMAFRADSWFLRFPCSWVIDGKLPRQRNDQVESLALQDVDALLSVPSSRRLLRTTSTTTASFTPHQRRQLSNVGLQRVGIVIVHAADSVNPLSVTAAEQMLQTANQQFQDCSGHAMELVQQDDTVTITLPKNIGQYSSGSVDADMFRMICEYYGYSSGCEISKKRDLDHVRDNLNKCRPQAVLMCSPCLDSHGFSCVWMLLLPTGHV